MDACGDNVRMFLSHCQINLLIWKKFEEEESHILQGVYGIIIFLSLKLWHGVCFIFNT